MKRNEILAILGTVALGGGLLTGCSLEGDACTTDSDCSGYSCDLSAPNEEGQGTCFTECTTNTQCATGFACNAGECAPGNNPGPGPTPGACTVDSDCTGGYTCENGACNTACTDGSECIDGFVCTSGDCSFVAPDPYRFVAVLSEVPASSSDVSDSTTPGPDVDAVELRQGTATIYASTVVSHTPGSVGSRGNNANNPNDILGAPNSMTGAGPQYQCDVDRNYLSLGANDGFVIVSFANNAEIGTGDTVRVYELERRSCSNSIANRADVYSVYINQNSNAATAQAIRSGADWCSLGTTPNNVGGVFDFAVNLANCP